jgi:hypothetical protein
VDKPSQFSFGETLGSSFILALAASKSVTLDAMTVEKSASLEVLCSSSTEPLATAGASLLAKASLSDWL